MFIYKITNIVNGKVYIGQTGQDVEARFIQHRCCLRHNRHANGHLQNAWNKYGPDNFLFEVLDSNVDALNIDTLERRWINQYDALNPERGYNMQSGGGARRFNSEETKRKISQKNKGKKRTEAEKQKMSLRMMGNSISKGNKLSELTRSRMSSARSGKNNVRSRAIINTETGEVFASIGIAAAMSGMNYSTLRDALRGRYKKKTKFKYLEVA
jgi:group I intron endonuclease